MNNLTIEIISCPVYSYKLRGEGIDLYHEQALLNAKKLYLDMYEHTYQKLMMNGFNPLWTPDTKAENDLDFKDDFGKATYFFFNTCLIKILSEKYEIDIVDRTKSVFDDQYHFYSFFEEKGIPYEVPYKNSSRIAPHKIKQFIVEEIKNSPKILSKKVDHLKEKFSLQNRSVDTPIRGKIVYLYLHSFKGMSLNEYLNWRYGGIIPHLEKNGFQIIVLSTIDFKGSGSIDYPFFNVNQLVSHSEIRKAYMKSLLYKTKVNVYKAREWNKSSTDTEKKYFLANLPTDFFYALREISGLDNLFKEFGPGLLLLKGPVNNKGASSVFFTAKENGVRVLVISPRILTSTRFSNQFIRTHFLNNYPDIYPHSIAVDDRVSLETIKNQASEIELYRVKQDGIIENSSEEVDFEPFRITLILQKKKEIQEMAEYVIRGVEGLSNVVLQFKEHPSFPIPKKLSERYNELPNVEVLQPDTSLEETIQKTDLCLTSYSSAALEFVKNGKPVIWLENVTSNSIFFTDLYRTLGLSSKSSDELKSLIQNFIETPGKYYQERDRQYEQVRNLLFYSGDESIETLPEIIDKEFEKV